MVTYYGYYYGYLLWLLIMCMVTYYGKTYRRVFTRVAEHEGISNLSGKRLKCVKQSAVSDHLLECNCSIDTDHFDILTSDASKFRLLIK